MSARACCPLNRVSTERRSCCRPPKPPGNDLYPRIKASDSQPSTQASLRFQSVQAMQHARLRAPAPACLMVHRLRCLHGHAWHPPTNRNAHQYDQETRTATLCQILHPTVEVAVMPSALSLGAGKKSIFDASAAAAETQNEIIGLVLKDDCKCLYLLLCPNLQLAGKLLHADSCLMSALDLSRLTQDCNTMYDVLQVWLDQWGRLRAMAPGPGSSVC